MASMGTLNGTYEQYTELRQWILENGNLSLFEALCSEFVAYHTQQDFGWCNIANFSEDQDRYLWNNCPLEWLRIDINNISFE